MTGTWSTNFGGDTIKRSFELLLQNDDIIQSILIKASCFLGESKIYFSPYQKD